MKKRDTNSGNNFVNNLFGIDQITEQIMDAYNSSVIEQSEYEKDLDVTNEPIE